MGNDPGVAPGKPGGGTGGGPGRPGDPGKPGQGPGGDPEPGHISNLPFFLFLILILLILGFGREVYRISVMGKRLRE